MFSRTCQYALQAVLFIALHHNNQHAVGLKEISQVQNIPIHFLGKILQILVKQKILASQKGPKGGFSLNISPHNLTLLEIVEVTDGLEIFDRCGIGMKECSDRQPCPIHHEYKPVRNKIKELFSSKTIAQLCEDVEEGKSIVAYVNPN